MGRTRFALMAGTVLLASSALVHAQNAYTSGPTNVRAGPDRTYPLVAQLPPGASVDVDGCLDDWSWCDVAFDDTHGWVYSPSLSYVYQGERVPFYSYAPSFGLPVITFSLGAYWDHYYRGRPWFAQRNDWEHRHIEHRRPSGPAPRSTPPPRGGAGFRAEPNRSGSRFRSRAGSGVPERATPERTAPERAVPGRAVPERSVPERGPRENANSGRANTSRQITPHHGAAERPAPSSRAEQHGEQGRSGERPQNGRGDKRDEHRGDQPH